MRTGGVACVFAHPDDEQFGTAGALLDSAERGMPVHVVCATRGDKGEISDPRLATPETLGSVREGELRAACDILGIEPPILLDYGDGTLSEVDPGELRDRVAAELRRIAPEIVITFDAVGGYGHPDHIAIHHATLAAVHALGADGPAKLYVTAYPKSNLTIMNEGMAALGLPPLNFGSVQTIDASEMGTADASITTTVSVERFFQQRMAALLAHRTQFGPDNPFVRFPDGLNRRLFATDSFVRLKPLPEPGAALPDEAHLHHKLDHA